MITTLPLSTLNNKNMKKFVSLLVSLLLVSYTHAAQTTPIPDIAPSINEQYVVINIPQQRLFFYENGQLIKVYPVAVGKAVTQTTLGEHKIGAKTYNPTWHIPLSIQRERGDGVTTIPPGPSNPLGPVFVRMGDPKLGLGIHGTNNPSSVPGVRSHGCVRMKSPDALAFARAINRGTTVMVSYELAALNVDDANNLWLAVFKDPYKKRNLAQDNLKQTIQNWAEAHGYEVNHVRIDQIIKAQTGKATCLTCTHKNTPIQGDLKSIAWNSGSIELTIPKGSMSIPTEIIPPEDTEVKVNPDNNASQTADSPINFQETSFQSEQITPIQPINTEALPNHH